MPNRRQTKKVCGFSLSRISAHRLPHLHLFQFVHSKFRGVFVIGELVWATATHTHSWYAHNSPLIRSHPNEICFISASTNYTLNLLQNIYFGCLSAAAVPFAAAPLLAHSHPNPQSNICTTQTPMWVYYRIARLLKMTSSTFSPLLLTISRLCARPLPPDQQAHIESGIKLLVRKFGLFLRWLA